MSESGETSDIAWQGALTCPCGRPYILLKIDEVVVSKNKELQPLATYVRCPVHRRVRRLFLPYSRLTEWIGAVADRVFRCNHCGEPAEPRKAATKGHFSIVLIDCPDHGVDDNKRILWSPIYTAAKAVQEIKLVETPELEVLLDEDEDILPICPKCGTENDADARYCAYCGNLIE